MSEIQITPIEAFQDNYIWAIHNRRHALLVDPGEAAPCIAFLESHHLSLDGILVTHHHNDHTGGILELDARYSMPVYGPANEPIPGLTHPVSEGYSFSFKNLDLGFTTLHTPGHTLGHCCYYTTGLLFCGDTLFSCGCGRIFEGTPQMMLHSLKRLSQFPEDTKIFCAHEYTISNISFAKTVDPDNMELLAAEQKALLLRHDGQPTLPSTIGREKSINPFLRCSEPDIVNSVAAFSDKPARNELEIFTRLRLAKNTFR